jgi:chromosome partitioning protein
MSIRITVTNNKGGVAKTTTVVNTAAALAAVGFRVLVVDTDPQGNATMHLGGRETALATEKHLATAIEGKTHVADLIIPSNIEKVSLLASHPSLREVPARYAEFKTQFELFRHPLGTPDQDKLSDFDFVLFDTNPALNSILASALDISNYYIIPLFAEIEPIVGLIELREWLEKTVAATARKVSMMGILITNFDKNNATHRQMIDFLVSNLPEGTNVFEARIPSSNTVKASALSSTPLISLRNGTSPAAVGYSQLVAEIINLLAKEGLVVSEGASIESEDSHVSNANELNGSLQLDPNIADVQPQALQTDSQN